MKSFLQWLKSLFGVLPVSAPPVSTSNYINYPGDYIIPIPGMAADTMLYCFPVHGDYAKMQKVVDQRLNFSPFSKQVRYFPMSSFMLMAVSDIKRGYTLDESYKKYGVLEEKALQIFMPVVECVQTTSGDWSAQRIMFFLPYIFVDQPLNVSIGREELGFPKAFGQITMPANPNDETPIKINAYGFQKFNRENPEYGVYHPLLEIKKVSGSAEKGEWKNNKEVWESIKGHMNIEEKAKQFSYSIPFLFHELKDLVNETIPMIFLKQFRDIEDPSKACYQAITEGDGVNHKFHKGWLLGGTHEIEIQDFASFPLKEDLGLPAKFTVKHSFWVNCDLKFKTGKVLWQAN